MSQGKPKGLGTWDVITSFHLDLFFADPNPTNKQLSSIEVCVPSSSELS